MSGPMDLEPRSGQEDTLMLRLAVPKRPVRTPLGDAATLMLRLPDPGALGLRLPGPARDEEAVNHLAAEMADRIGSAVHPYEVAALLEADGLSADTIRQRYGHPDLFSLAAALYERVPRVFPEPPRAPDPWRPDTLRCLLRGVLFALPALAYPLLAPLWHPGRQAVALVVAGILSWAWGQALGHRAYLWMAVGRREACRTLLRGAPLGAALATAAAAVPAQGSALTWGAAAQSLYLGAAGVLLVLGRELLLLAALSPVVAGAALLPWWDPGPVLRAGLPALALAGTVAAAGWALRDGFGTPAAAGDAAAGPPLLRSLPYGLFGLAAGLLVLQEGVREPYAVIVLTVSMGPAEWLLYRYRGLSAAALAASTSPAGFLLRSTGVLALCLLAYTAPLVPAALLTGAAPATLPLLAAALWTALLLQAFGAAWPPALICLAAAGTAGAVTLFARTPQPSVLPLCSGIAALCLTGCVLRLLGRPAPHA
ncbi:hypothetical protein [Streptomyces sp. WAC06614]|uniref:hypothetical protein n=1 Tax=Streptomyces sp. WAC06614 TaxID=2487416 RepID=UPI000F775403|nr:hypothetical protein [Streptomyces sp. WAC06614]RSS78179.1 hypothetical protein EF918_21940 [Streptomyces sp. WAC06614]